MKKVLLVIVFVAVAVVFIASGCKQKEKSENKYYIAVIPKGTTHVFWKSIHAGAIKAEQELKEAGIDVEVIWKGPLKEDDRESQIRVVEDFVTRGVSGIVLAPLDDVALRMSVKDAVNNGIPVVIIDSGLKSEDYTSFVSTDNYIGGRKGGERLAEILGGKGKVIMLRYQEGSASTMNRERGFLDVLKEKYPAIEVVSSNQYGGATTESAYLASENLLAPLRKPDGGLTIDGIFCPNESTTFGMLRALEDGGLAGKVKYVGFDSSNRLVLAMRKGYIKGLVLQDPINMGYLGVKMMVAHLRGEKVEKRIDTGSAVATPENMDEPKMKNLLEPDFKKWLNE
ncbi:MAG: substrate-binding domain-containing protein [Planctomycetes bacterium]|nr:substrate-binding domain-containing protein [Planctomycetota bacterium]MCH8119248.1 substrate-binding domain-containing protein [Planctomycetota bacterium]